MRCDVAQALRAVQHLHGQIMRGQAVAQSTGRVRLGHDREAGPPPNALLEQIVHAAHRTEREDLETIGMAGQDIQRVAAHRAGGAEDADAFALHGRGNFRWT